MRIFLYPCFDCEYKPQKNNGNSLIDIFHQCEFFAFENEKCYIAQLNETFSNEIDSNGDTKLYFDTGKQYC